MPGKTIVDTLVWRKWRHSILAKLRKWRLMICSKVTHAIEELRATENIYERIQRCEIELWPVIISTWNLVLFAPDHCYLTTHREGTQLLVNLSSTVPRQTRLLFIHWGTQLKQKVWYTCTSINWNPDEFDKWNNLDSSDWIIPKFDQFFTNQERIFSVLKYNGM